MYNIRVVLPMAQIMFDVKVNKMKEQCEEWTELGVIGNHFNINF